MARQTRQERRARRAQQQQHLPGGQPKRPPVARRPASSDSAARRRQPGEERRIPGSGLFTFFQESVAELKKVEWPSQKAVISGTAVVLITDGIGGPFRCLNN